MLHLMERERQKVKCLNENYRGVKVSEYTSPKYYKNAIKRSRKLENGTYASVVRLTDSTVLKVSQFDYDFYADFSRLYRSERVESIIHNLLWKHCVQTNLTNHIVMPYKSAVVEDHAVIHLLEYANLGDAAAYLRSFNSQNLDETLRYLLFQVVFTLCAIYKVFPTFRHNDLKLNNIFIHKTTAVNNTIYQTDDGYIFAPNGPFMALIGDFDFASISGIVENYKVLSMAFGRPTLNINSVKNHSADLYVCVRTLCGMFGHVISKQFGAELLEFWNIDIFDSEEDDNYSRLPAYCTLPSAQEVLRSKLFTKYRIEQNVDIDPMNCLLIRSFTTQIYDSIPAKKELFDLPFFGIRPAYQRLLTQSEMYYRNRSTTLIKGDIILEETMENAQCIFIKYGAYRIPKRWLSVAKKFTQQRFVPQKYWILVFWASWSFHLRFATDVPNSYTVLDYREWIEELGLSKEFTENDLIQMQMQFNWFVLFQHLS